MNNVQNSINHHYIPQFIIKNFYSENLLYSYNPRTKKINTRQYSSKHVCSEKHAHTLNIDGEKCLEIEKFFSQIEGEMAKIISYINDNETLFTDHIFPHEYLQKEFADFFKIIAYFLSLSFWRLPRNKDLANKKRKKIKKLYKKYEKEETKILEIEKDFLLEIASKHNDSKEAEDAAKKIIQYLILPVIYSRVSDAIHECKFVKTNINLILSDHLIICDIDDNNATLTNDIYIPLSPKLCLTNKSNNIQNFQKNIFKKASHIVMANSKEILEELSKV